MEAEMGTLRVETVFPLTTRGIVTVSDRVPKALGLSWRERVHEAPGGRDAQAVGVDTVARGLVNEGVPGVVAMVPVLERVRGRDGRVSA